MIASPYFWLALLLGALLLSSGSYHKGWDHATNAAKAAQKDVIEKAVADAVAKAKADADAAREFENRRERARAAARRAREKADADIEKNPGYGLCGLSPDGLRLYNDERAADLPGAPSSGADAVPGSADGSGREAVDDPAQQPGAGEDVPRMPVAPGGAGGVGAPVDLLDRVKAGFGRLKAGW